MFLLTKTSLYLMFILFSINIFGEIHDSTQEEVPFQEVIGEIYHRGSKGGMRWSFLDIRNFDDEIYFGERKIFSYLIGIIPTSDWVKGDLVKIWGEETAFDGTWVTYYNITNLKLNSTIRAYVYHQSYDPNTPPKNARKENLWVPQY